MKDKRPFYILGAVAIVLLLVFVLMRDGGSRFDWAEHYEEDSKDPYGTFVIHEMLNSYFPNNKFTDIKNDLATELPIDSSEISNYVFVGESMFLDSADVSQLMKFVDAGNNAFISSKTIPYDMMSEIYYDECNGYPWDEYYSFVDSSVVFNFIHQDFEKEKGFKYDFLYQNKKAEYGWNYIDSVYFCEEDFSFIELGTIDDRRINFVKKEYGGGAFYLHTTPIAFSNIQLLDKVGVEYSNKVFSHLEEGDIYWDAYSRETEGLGRAYNNRARGGGSRSIASEESLKYILAQPSLASAWYLTLLLGLLYLFFRAKRRQRIIPVLEENKNTSFEYISTIGSLYFLKNDHKKLCAQKMKLFTSFIRDKYNISTSTFDDEFKEKLTAKSEISLTLINRILDLNRNISSSSFVSEQTLIDFHQIVDEFYKNCK